MNLVETIAKDTIDAMKNSNKFELSVLRMLKSSLQMEKINKKHDLDDDETIAVIKKQVKVRKDSIEEYTKYNRLDLVENLKNEVEVLSKYLPEELSIEAIKTGLEEIFSEVNPTSIKDMGLIMKKATEKFAGKADMKEVNILVRQELEK